MSSDLWQIIGLAGIDVDAEPAEGEAGYRWRVAGGLWSEPLPSREAALAGALRFLVAQAAPQQDVVDVNEERPPDPEVADALAATSAPDPELATLLMWLTSEGVDVYQSPQGGWTWEASGKGLFGGTGFADEQAAAQDARTVLLAAQASGGDVDPQALAES
jgi:hypothetical protein